MKKTWVFRCIGLLLFTISVLMFSGNTSEVHAATSYTNAREYYLSAPVEDDRCEMYGGNFYSGSRAKTASSNSLKYRTIGFDITLSAGGRSLRFSVARGQSLATISDDPYSDGYTYSLWYVPRSTIEALAKKVDASTAEFLFSQSNIDVRVDHIMTTMSGSTLNGGVSETGNGTVSSWGTVYYLRNYSDLERMWAIFNKSRHSFEGYYDVHLTLHNYTLTVYYNANGGTVSSPYTLGTFEGASNMVFGSGSILKESKTMYQTINLYNDTTLGLSRTGYHLDSGKEWTFSGRVFNQNYDYNTVDINSNVSYKNDNAVMTANWKPNTYSIKYDANGGKGTVASTSLTYDVTGNIRNNTFTRTGYKLVEGAEWNTKADGTGTSYSSNQAVTNLTSTNGATITLYAQWEPCEYKITTFKDGGTGGNDVFYELYENHFFNSEDTKGTAISSIVVPTKTGYNFKGYFSGYRGLGTQIVDSDGNILVGNTYYTSDSYIFASWTPKEYTVTFDKQGGIEGIGTDSAKVIYNETYPTATAPVKTEYTFKGYYSHPDGRGEMYYTENMAPLKRHTIDGDITLYAKWVDEAIPRTNIEVSTSNWTNTPDGIEVIGTAKDKGSGLDYAELYCDTTMVAEARDLNGANEVELTFTHKEEGIYRYRIVAYDLAGNVSVSYETVRYDITAPEAEGDTPGKEEQQYQYTLNNEYATEANLSNFTIELFVSDYKYDWGTGTEIGAYYSDGTFIPWSNLIKKGIVTSTDIPWGAFTGENGEGLVKLVMSNKIVYIGDNAFEGCTELETVQFSKKVEYIGDYVFSGCTSLKSITIPNTVTHLGMYAFLDCTGLVSADIPSSIGSINEGAFYGCTSLENIVIPEGITTVETLAFDGCTGAKTLTVPITVKAIGENAFPTPMFDGVEGYWFDEVINKGYAASEIPTGVSAVYKAVKIDGLFDANGVMLASWDELVNTYGFNINVSAGVTGSLGDVISKYPALSSAARLVIGEGVTSIGANAFTSYTALTSVVLPSTLETIGDYAFKQSGVTSIVIPSNVSYVGIEAFQSAKLQSVVIKDGVTSISDRAFVGNNYLQSISIPATLTSIGTDAFSGCGRYISGFDGSYYQEGTCNGYLPTEIPAGVEATYIALCPDGLFDADGKQLASWDELVNDYGFDVTTTSFNDLVSENQDVLGSGTKLIIDDSVTSIGNKVFMDCSYLTEVILPDNLVSIGDYAFANCSLSLIELPSTLVSIGECGFRMNLLTDVYLPDGFTTLKNGAFSGNFKLYSIRVPSTLSTYTNALPTPTTQYHDYADGLWYNIRGVGYNPSSIPTGVEATYYAEKQGAAFYSDGTVKTWDELIAEDIGVTKTSFTSSAFSYNTELTYLVVPDSVTEIYHYAFEECTSLEGVVLSNNLSYIYTALFLNCSSLKSIVIPDGVLKIQEQAFQGCTSLSSVTLNEGLVEINTKAFYNCQSLTTIKIPNSVTLVDDTAFWGGTRGRTWYLTSIYYNGQAGSSWYKSGTTIYAY